MLSISVSIPPWAYDDDAAFGRPTTLVEVDETYRPLPVPAPPRLPHLSQAPSLRVDVVEYELDRPGWSVPLTLPSPSVRVRVSLRPTMPIGQGPDSRRSVRPSVKPTVRPVSY